MKTKKVLVVEDDRDLSKILGIRLRMEGYATAMAHDGDEAAAAVRETPPDVILLDIGLPGEDGYAVLRRLRAAGFEAPVIMVSAYDRHDHGPRALAAGAAAFVQKPIDWSSLATALQVALATPQLRPRGSARPSLVPGPTPKAA